MPRPTSPSAFQVTRSTCDNCMSAQSQSQFCFSSSHPPVSSILDSGDHCSDFVAAHTQAGVLSLCACVSAGGGFIWQNNACGKGLHGGHSRQTGEDILGFGVYVLIRFLPRFLRAPLSTHHITSDTFAVRSASPGWAFRMSSTTDCQASSGFRKTNNSSSLL